MDDMLFVKIKDYLVKEQGSFKVVLKRETTLEGDLKITGQDAYDFIESFSKEFNVDIKDLNWSKYFAGEGITAALIGLFGFDSKENPLTLGDLEKAVKKGKLT